MVLCSLEKKARFSLMKLSAEKKSVQKANQHTRFTVER